jgi:AraC-like DNA-binding protein
VRKIVKNISGRGNYRLPAGINTRHFSGNEWRLILVESGSAVYQFDCLEKLEVETGSLFLLGPGSRSIIAGDRKPFAISIIFFDHCLEFSTENFLLFKPRGAVYRLLREMFGEIHGRAKDSCHDSLLDHLLHLFLRDREAGLGGDQRILQALEILQRQAGVRLEAAELARRVGLSRAHFYTLFRAYTGDSYAQWVRKSRMQLALTLMQEFGLSAKEVAHEIGSSSAQAFSREFKAYFGQSPKKYLQGV